MLKLDALESIKKAWDDPDMKLGEKVISITSDYSSAGLDLATTAAHIHATPAELDFFLSLGELDDEILDELSEVNPPKTTWVLLANGSDEEIEGALKALRFRRQEGRDRSGEESTLQFVYASMIDAGGPTKEQLIGALSGDVLRHALKKGENYNVLNDWEKKFLKSVSAQKKRGKTMSEKQNAKVIGILEKLADEGAITRDSIDGDIEICDEILDALGR